MELTEPRTDEIDLRDLGRALIAGRWMIGATTVAIVVAALGYAFLATPVFRAEALVQIRQEQGGLPASSGLGLSLDELANLAGMSRPAASDRALALATLQSRIVIQSFIEENGLLPALFASKWDGEGKRWKTSDPSEVPTLWHGVRYFTSKVMTVTEDKKSGLVTVSIDWRDPQQAALWVTDLIARTNAHLRSKTVAESEARLEYLRQQARQTGFVELQGSAYKLVEAELKRLMLAKGSEEFAIRTIDPAQEPQQRIWPRRLRIVAGALLLGAIFGAVLVIVRHALAGPIRPR